MVPMQVRLRVAADDEEWLRLRSALWPELCRAVHESEMAAWLGRLDTVVLIAARKADGSGAGGFAEVGSRSVADGCDTSPVAYLEGWYVDADLRGQGVGGALICAAEGWARARGFRELASDAQISNTGSQKAHEALGFKEVGRSVLYVKLL
jgi:aminoglycoside 6'-N-acetyltransferase I